MAKIRTKQTRSRKEKEQGLAQASAEQFYVPRVKPKPLEALNPTQHTYIESLNTSPITLVTGNAGTSKTYIPTRLASLWLKQRAIRKLILVRPAVSASQSVGFAKGTHEEKMEHWLMPILETLEEEFSQGQLSDMMRKEVGMLRFCPLENIKGNSWHNSFVIVDEAEDCTLKEIISLVTRVGRNTTLVLCGDTRQCDLAESGLGKFVELRERNTRLRRITQHIHFGKYEEIVRSDTCREMVMALDELGM